MSAIDVKRSWKIIILIAGVLIAGLAAGVMIGRIGTGPEAAGLTAEQGQELYTCPMHPQVIQEGPGQCPICGMNLVPVDEGSTLTAGLTGEPGKEKKILYWVAPMDPTFISDKPGKSPMGMDLVPVYEGAEPGVGAAVIINPSMVQTMGVRTEEAVKGALVRTLRAAGTFEVNEESLAIVNTKIEGWIEKLYVNRTGQEVKKGEALLSIYSPSLVSTQEEYLAAVRHLESVRESPYEDVVESARSLVDASEQRLRYWDISASQINRLKSTGEVARTLTLYAPQSGVVIHKGALEGMEVKAGQELLRIADLETLWLQAKLYEQDIPWVAVGDRAGIEVDYLPGETISGEVEYIYPYLDNATRDLTARIRVDNPGLKLKPGMFATVTIRHRTADEVILIPDEAVIHSGERNVVFIDLGEGRFAPREIKLGLMGDNRMVEVRSGVQAGERVVTSAQFMLDSESRLQEALKKMLESRKEAPSHEGHSVSDESQASGGDAGAAGRSVHEHALSGAGSRLYAESTEHPGHTDDTAGESMDMPEGSHEEQPREPLKIYYTCPMEEDSEIVSEGPGVCPKCGMKLVPVDEVPYDHPLKHQH